MAELVDSYSPLDCDLIFSMHWTIVIRGIAYKLVRRKGSSNAELKLTPYGLILKWMLLEFHSRLHR